MTKAMREEIAHHQRIYEQRCEDQYGEMVFEFAMKWGITQEEAEDCFERNT
jgi:hypothetical protein